VSYFLFPLVAGIAVCTVYLRYHHAVDPLFGLVLGLVCYPVAVAILKKRQEDAAPLRH
jgi:membrane-associated phospholipid phosphatase